MSKLILDEVKLKKSLVKFRSVTHPMRMKIVEMLSESPKLNVTHIYTVLKLEQPAVSFHLKLLRQSGIVNAKREGKEIYYSLNTENLGKLIDCIERFNK